MQRSCVLAALAALVACGSNSSSPKVLVGFAVSRVTPSKASLAGGGRVLVQGDGFSADMQVAIGGHPATGVVLVDSHALTCLVPPASAAGDADVVVQTSGGNTATLRAGVTYAAVTAAAPKVSSVAPGTGPHSGGTVGLIGGEGFSPGAVLFIGGHPADLVTVVGATSLSGRFPALPDGAADVTVTNPDGQSGTLAGGFGYVAVSGASPRLTGLLPQSGPIEGGAAVDVTGVGFQPGARVFVGGVPAAASTAGATAITLVMPAGLAGSADVAVTNPDGQSDVLPAGYLYFNAPPVITAVSPTCGPATGGTSITITGRSLRAGIGATVGGLPLTGLRNESGTLSGTTAAHASGAVDVVVTNPDGQSDTLSGGFFFTDATHPCQSTNTGVLSLQRVVPESGPQTGGSVVTLLGDSFGSGMTVSFGAVAATDVRVYGATSLTATAPAAAATGPVDVSISLRGSTSTLRGGFTYFDPTSPSPAPILASVTPNTGPSSGGTLAVITGGNFQAGARVFFGATEAPAVTLLADQRLVVSTPAAPTGGADVTVMNPDGKAATLPDAFAYYGAGAAGSPPLVQHVDPRTGSTLQPSTVAVAGSGFQAGALVFFGGVPATGVSLQPDGTLAATVAPQGPGSVDVAVTNPDGQSSTLVQGFTFAAPAPKLSAIQPVFGPLAGGTTAIVAGSGFVSGDVVAFGGVAAVSSRVVDQGAIFAVVPAHAAGIVDVTLLRNGTVSSTLAAAFEYRAGYVPSPAPTIAALEPATGPVSGGTVLWMTGTNFSAGMQVFFGPAPGAKVILSDVSHAVVIAPPGTAGLADVNVINPDGQAGALLRGFAYVSDALLSGFAPALTAATPDHGPESIDTADILTGRNFVTGEYVFVGAARGAGVRLLSSSIINTTFPHQPAAVVDVAVTHPDGRSSILHNGFTFLARPTVVSVASAGGAAAGSTSGGTGVTIAGTGFQSGATVLFGNAPATNVSVASASIITAATPAGTKGVADVTVKNPDGQSATLAGGWLYVAPPAATAVWPPAGPPAGGTIAVVSGTDFDPGAVASIGGVTLETVAGSATSLAITMPAGTGTVDIRIDNPDGQSTTLAGAFTYAAATGTAPTLTAIAPPTGPSTGGSWVAVAGSGFAPGSRAILGGAFLARGAVASATAITGLTPAHPVGLARLAVTTPDGLSARLNGAFAYVDPSTLGPAPAITNTLPASLPAAPGGAPLAIVGSNFAPGAIAFVQGRPAPVQGTPAPSSLTVTTPAGQAGAADVAVTNPDGQTAIASNVFVFTVPPPQLDATAPLSPTRGPTSGKTAVAIKGSYFLPPVQVFFGNSAATVVSANDHEIDVQTPAGVNGPASVFVVNRDGQQSTLLPGGFYYNAPPVITSVSPTSGAPAGGYPVAISGQYFSGTASTIAVKFGSTAAVISGTPTSSVITVTAPASPGSGTQTVAVSVTNDDGQSTTLAQGFVYLAPAQAPTVSGVTPNTGALQGGDTVTVLGANFQFGASVSFGGVAAQSVIVTSAGALNCTAPATTVPGSVDVVVRNPDGQQATLAGGYTYLSGPPPAALSLTFIEPSQGDSSGGTRVLIGGTGFQAGATVTFVPHDGSACTPPACSLTSVDVLGPTAITATVPRQPLSNVANYDLFVSQGSGSQSLLNAWTYASGRRRWVPQGLRLPLESHNGKVQRGISGTFTPAWSGVIGSFTQQTPGVADVWFGGGNGRAPRLYQGAIEAAGAAVRDFTDLSRNQKNPDGTLMVDNCCGSSSPWSYRPYKPQAFDLDANGWQDIAWWNDDRHVFTIEWNQSGLLQTLEYGGPYGSIDPTDWAGGYDANGRLIDLNLDGAPDFVFTDGGGRRPWVLLSCATGLAGPTCSEYAPSTFQVSIPPGTQTILNSQIGNLQVGDLTRFLVAGQTKLIVDSGPSYEVVTVSAVTSSGFSATFAKAHTAGTAFSPVFDLQSTTSVPANADTTISVSSLEGFGLSYGVTLVAEPGTAVEERVNLASADYVNGLFRFHFVNAHTAPFRLTSKHARSFIADASRFPPSATDSSYSVVAGDIDGNGSIDVITGNSQQGIKVWLNDAANLKASGGDPNAFSFTLATSTTIPSGVTSGNVRALALFDANGDLLPDLLVGYDGNTQERIFINRGSGIFADETSAAQGTGCKAGGALPRLPLPLNDSVVRYDIRDMNGDGSPDVLAWIQVNGTANSFQKPLRYWQNDGAGCFVAVTNVGGTKSLTDILFPPILGAMTWTYALGDINGDGYPDMIAGLDGIQTREYVNLGTPAQFVDKTMSNFPAATSPTDSVRWWRWTRGSLLVDLNGDGYPDLVTTQTSSDPNTNVNGGGVGGVQRQAYLPPDGSGIHVYLNDRSGNFPHDDTLTTFPSTTDPNTGQQVSALPIASWSMDAAQNLWNAPGAPQAIAISSATEYSNGVPAILKGTPFDNPYGSTRLLIKGAGGNFVDATYPRLPTGKTFGMISAIKFVDLDGDGNPDILLGDAGSGALYVWQNEGNGYFADVTSTAVQPGQLGNPCGTNRVNQIVVANFDQDANGLPDILAVRDCQSRLLINRSNPTDGIKLVDESTCDGTFCTTPRLPNPPPGAYSAVVANLDCVGGQDIFLLQADSSGSPRVLLNSVSCAPGTPCGFFTDASNTFLQNTSACVGTDCGGNQKAVGLRYDSTNTDIFIARYSADGQVRPHRLLKNTCGPLAEYSQAAWKPLPVDDDKIIDVAVGSLFVNNTDPNAVLEPDLLLTGYFATRIYQNVP